MGKKDLVERLRMRSGDPDKGKGATKKVSYKPIPCAGCDRYMADPPSEYCPGCQAYMEHQR
jgi:hypothetical protein